MNQTNGYIYVRNHPSYDVLHALKIDVLNVQRYIKKTIFFYINYYKIELNIYI
jgi:hypothetical protein